MMRPRPVVLAVSGLPDSGTPASPSPWALPPFPVWAKLAAPSY